MHLVMDNYCLELSAHCSYSTSKTFRSMPNGASQGAHKRLADMSKMVTLVPPFNPFNRKDGMPQKLEMK